MGANHFLALADALAITGQAGLRSSDAPEFCFQQWRSPIGNWHFACTPHFPSPTPSPVLNRPQPFATRDCLAKELGELQQVLGEELVWTTFLRNVPLFPFTWKWLKNTKKDRDAASSFFIGLRFLISCSLLLPRAAQVSAAETGLTPSRSFMGFAAPFTNKRKAYSERRIMG